MSFSPSWNPWIPPYIVTATSRVPPSSRSMRSWCLAGIGAPAKHQLRINLDDGGTLLVAVTMYGGIQVFHDGENDNPYYRVATTKPSPLTPAFDARYFATLLADDDAARLSAKAFLATGQRIPGLGNGVLQDILWSAGLQPRCKVGTLPDADLAPGLQARAPQDVLQDAVAQPWDALPGGQERLRGQAGGVVVGEQGGEVPGVERWGQW